MCESAHRHSRSRGLSGHIIKWPVSGNYGEACYLGETIGTRGGAFDSYLQDLFKDSL